uniref:Legume lectin domain-containing protein n=1 Tax=Populus trichocarpa TaxID=3694 RepID=B9I876_POPTR
MIEIILERSSMLATYISFYFMDFLIGKLTKNKFVAIEFDTKLDAHFNDPNDHYVGLNINSLDSIKTTDLILQDIDLKSEI